MRQLQFSSSFTIPCDSFSFPRRRSVCVCYIVTGSYLLPSWAGLDRYLLRLGPSEPMILVPPPGPSHLPDRTLAVSGRHILLHRNLPHILLLRIHLLPDCFRIHLRSLPYPGIPNPCFRSFLCSLHRTLCLHSLFRSPCRSLACFRPLRMSPGSVSFLPSSHCVSEFPCFSLKLHRRWCQRKTSFCRNTPLYLPLRPESPLPR